MHRSMPEWRLKTCMWLLCVKPPIVLGAARASKIYFANAEVAEAAVRCLAELEGGLWKHPNQDAPQGAASFCNKEDKVSGGGASAPSATDNFGGASEPEACSCGSGNKNHGQPSPHSIYGV